VFNDVTKGNNVVPGEIGTQYQSGVGYDLASGLGSVNVSNLVNNWNTVIFRPTSTTLNLSPTTNISHGQSVTVTASVTPNSGTGTPTGDVSLTAQTGSSSSGQTLVDSFSLTSGSVNFNDSAGSVPGNPFVLNSEGNTATPNFVLTLPAGQNSISASYGGDASFKPSSSTAVSVTIAKGSTATVLTSSSSSVGQGSSV